MRAYSSCTKDTRVVYTGTRVTEPMYRVHALPAHQAREWHTRKSGLAHTRVASITVYTHVCGLQVL